MVDANPLLTQAGYLVDNWQGSQYQKEYLKVFFLFLQVSGLDDDQSDYLTFD